MEAPIFSGQECWAQGPFFYFRPLGCSLTQGVNLVPKGEVVSRSEDPLFAPSFFFGYIRVCSPMGWTKAWVLSPRGQLLLWGPNFPPEGELTL
jgi:hypothetical protein